MRSAACWQRKAVCSHRRRAAELESYAERDPNGCGRRTWRLCARTCVPMLKENELIGAFTVFRQEVRPFTDKQIALVRTSPPRPSSPSRTRGCSTNCASARRPHRAHRRPREALEQQTATSEVLQVISSSPGDLAAGVRSHAGKSSSRSATQVRTIFIRWDGEVLHLVATHNTPAAFAEVAYSTISPECRRHQSAA